MTEKKHTDAPPAAPPAPPAPPAPDATPTPIPPVAGLPVEPPAEAIARLERELDAMRDKYLRLAAEYENFRKRTAKERAELWSRAQADLVQRLVDAFDDLARFAHVAPEQADARTLRDGVDLVEKKLWKELAAIGVRRLDQVGALFDPKVHEAVTTTPTDDPAQDHTVGTVLQAGYILGDVLLRPARVVVLTWPGS